EEIEGLGLCAPGHFQRPRGMKCRERRALLDGELVEREGVLRVGERAGELLAPGLHLLPLPRIDQVAGHALEIALGDGERGKSLFARVLATERFQARIVERLTA